MSSVVSGRKSIGSKSNKSGSSKRYANVSSRFWKPTISSKLKARELGLIKETEEENLNKEITENKPKTPQKFQRGKSPRSNKMYKSPAKPSSRLSNRFPSPAVKPRIPKVPRRINKVIKSKITNAKENKPFSPVVKKSALKKSVKKQKLINPVPVEGIDFRFEIPETLPKKRDKKLSEKVEEEKEAQKPASKELLDITNSNLDAISSSTPIRCLTGKSSVVRSSISLLQSDPGSGKSTPNVTPYKILRKNKENGKDGSKNIDDLTQKIKKLEEDIFKSKNMNYEDEYSENNEFLDGISQIDGNELLKKNLEDQGLLLVHDNVQKEEQTPKPVEENPEIGEENQDEDIAEIKELEAMIGQVFKTIKKDETLSNKLQSKIKAYESLTSDLLNSVSNVNKGENFEDSQEQVQTSWKTSKGSKLLSSARSARKRNKPGRRRRSNRNKTTYDCIEIYKQDCRDEEWFKDNEVWTRSRKRRNLGQN
ncbi:unnamed protein product [Moneuplotes crassus]|uniref:Uncharacterized protein n=1 Tax=Euplotes crassus TaxID=5936 RepID=A0AAD1UIM0_EUPCR|nr:unnamed protein product [Moneuplotes crassus]